MIVDQHEDRHRDDDQDVVERVDRLGLRRGDSSGTSGSTSPTRDADRGCDQRRWTTICSDRCASSRRMLLLMRLGILCGARDERQSGASRPARRRSVGAEVRNGCRSQAATTAEAAPRAPGRIRPSPAAARGPECRASRRRGARRRGSGACRGTPTERGRDGAGTPSRTGRAGGSRRGGRPRGRSARGSASSSAARSMRTRGEVLAERGVPDLGVGALQLAARGRDATRDVVERQVGAVLGFDDGSGVLEEARAVADRGGSSGSASDSGTSSGRPVDDRDAPLRFPSWRDGTRRIRDRERSTFVPNSLHTRRRRAGAPACDAPRAASAWSAGSALDLATRVADPDDE